MSTHNIGFYEDLTNIIFELSSNIIKYAPYFFCWTVEIDNGRNRSYFHIICQYDYIYYSHDVFFASNEHFKIIVNISP